MHTGRIIIVLFLVLHFLSAIGQPGQPVVIVSAAKECIIAYARNESQQNAAGNELLKEMAKAILKEPWRVDIRVAPTFRLSVFRSGGVDSLLISFTRPVITGDTVYRGFGIGRELTPGHADLRLRWASKADTSSFTGQDFNALETAILQGRGYRCPVGLFDPETDTLMVEKFTCYYDSADFSRFMARSGLIHNYYASAVLLDSLELMIKKVNPEDIALIPLNYFIIEEINQSLELIDSLHLEEELLSSQPDPLEVKRRYKNVYMEARSLTYTFMDVVRAVRSVSWEGPLQQLTRFYSGRILSFITRAQWMDNLQGTIYGSFLEYYPERIPFPEDSTITTRMLAKMFPDADPDTLEPFLIKALCTELNRRSHEMAVEKLYNEAFAMASFSRSLALAHGLKDYAVRSEMQMQQYGEGILNAFAGIASGCISTGRYTMADLYLAKAEAYAQQNRRWIRSDSAFRAEFARLFFLRNQRCDSLLAGERYREALDCLEKIEAHYPEKDVAVIRMQLEEKKDKARMGLYGESVRLTARALMAGEADSALAYDDRATQLKKETQMGQVQMLEQEKLADEIAVIRYNRLVEEAVEALDRRLFTLAVYRFEEAMDIALFHPVEVAPEFDSLFHRAARHYLIIQLGSSQKLIWANLFDSATAMLEHTGRSAASYGLKNDPDIAAAMERYRIKIRDQQCRNLADSLELRGIMADRARANRNYVQAVAGYRVCEGLAASLPECKADIQRYRDSIERYLPASGYQQLVTETGALMAAGNNPGAFALLLRTDSLFRAGTIGRYGLAEPDITGVLNDRGNPYLTVEAVKYYVLAGDPVSAYRFLQMMADQGMEEGMAGDVQEQVGRLMAVKDKKKNPLADPKTFLREFSGENPWFKTFRQAYLKTWKEN